MFRRRHIVSVLATATTKPGVEDQIRAIETEMQLAASTLNVNAVLRIEERFQALRTLALRENAALAPHMPRLRDLRSRFESMKAPLTKQLVDELFRLRAAISAAQHREETLKETVVWLSRTSGNDALRGELAGADVRSTVRHALPHAGTTERARLDRIVAEQNLWNELSMLSGPKLSKAIEAGRFAGGARAEVASLCPRGTTYSVRTYQTRANGAGPRRADPLSL